MWLEVNRIYFGVFLEVLAGLGLAIIDATAAVIRRLDADPDWDVGPLIERVCA